MSLYRNSLKTLAAGALALTLAACGASTGALTAPQIKSAAGQLQAKGVPPQSAFVTIKATVKEILPEDTHGLPHQNFVVTQISPNAGLVMEVNNDTKFGAKVPLHVGDTLTIRGVTYHDDKPTKDGIHWTHKATKAGDAGFIQTADGHKYE